MKKESIEAGIKDFEKNFYRLLENQKEEIIELLTTGQTNEIAGAGQSSILVIANYIYQISNDFEPIQINVTNKAQSLNF